MLIFAPLLGFGCYGTLGLLLFRFLMWKHSSFIVTSGLLLFSYTSLLVMDTTAISKEGSSGNHLFQRITAHGLGQLPLALTLFDGAMKKTGGASPRASALHEFNDCLQEAGLLDLKLCGSPFTWSNSSMGDSRIECKLDRVLVNASCMTDRDEVLPPSLSDHPPSAASKPI